MADTEKKTKGSEECCEKTDFSNCCEQMSKMMKQFRGAEKGEFDCMAMMQKMCCTPEQQNEQK